LCFFGLGELGFGLGFGELGFGLGLEELGAGLGVVVVELGVGVVVAGVEVDVLEGDVDESLVPDADGLDEGLPLAGVKDEAAVLNSDADEMASAAGAWLAADASVFAGVSGHVAEIVPWLLASAACNSANMLQPTNAKPASAPAAAGLSISALTCESSCAFWLR
jgi:hypothetical protein